MRLPSGLARLFRPPPLTLAGRGLTLRAVEPGDYEGWLDATRASEARLRRWQPEWPPDHCDRSGFARRLALFDRDRRAGTGYAFHVWADGRIEGAIRLSDVSRGARRAGRLGYWIADRAAGRGLATEAVRTVCGFAFGPLGLLRVEAAYVPENHASGRVLAKAGFRREGLARGYLAVAGRREDHVLMARLADDAPPGDEARTKPG